MHTTNQNFFKDNLMIKKNHINVIHLHILNLQQNFKLDAQWAEPVSLTCHFVLRKLYSEPSIGASYQISINLAKRF